MATTARVVILSRTKMSASNICVGGYDIDNNVMLRLLSDKAGALNDTYLYQVGETYEVTYMPRYQIEEPHTEDVAVYKYVKIQTVPGCDLSALTSLLTLKNLNLQDLFDGKLCWENDSGYIAESNNVKYSVTIATLKIDLYKEGSYYLNKKWGIQINKIKYVGDLSIDSMPNIIHSGTKIRFSLARMWDINKDGKRRSHLQLSGIYS